ncbi:MAG: hypothetical protein IPN38_13070 [Flavobacteriales bacterium]|nr:hypothetical protein [Flavobacteriales bacterium]
MFCRQPCDVLLFVLSTFIALFPYVLLFIILRPRPVVDNIAFQDGSIWFPVRNPDRVAINMLRVEACALLEDNTTLHLLTDLSDFVILPGRGSPDNVRVFKVIGLHPSALGYQQPNGAAWDLNSIVQGFQNRSLRIRVRVHGLHAGSGLGRAIEHVN